MPDNDEPLDDLRAVAMTAGAAAARVVETVVREQQNRAQQTNQAQQQQNATNAQPAAHTGAESSLLSNRRQSTGYDEQRPERDAALRAAGVPDEARQAKTTADVLNGTDPAAAAAAGTTTKARPTRAAAVAARERVR